MFQPILRIVWALGSAFLYLKTLLLSRLDLLSLKRNEAKSHSYIPSTLKTSHLSSEIDENVEEIKNGRRERAKERGAERFSSSAATQVHVALFL